MNEEIWCPISDYPDYDVSSLGAVRRKNKVTSSKPGIPLAGYYDKYGYHIVILYLRGSRRARKVHRLVAAAFFGGIQDHMQINHKNGVKNDNRISNLELVTCSQNVKHSYDELGRKGKNTNPSKGEKHHNSRFTEEEIRQIRDLYSQGETQKCIAKRFRTGQNHISRIIRRESWNHIN